VNAVGRAVDGLVARRLLLDDDAAAYKAQAAASTIGE